MATVEAAWHGAVPLDELAGGKLASINVGNREVLLARLGDEVFAVDNVCTHAEGWLDMGTLHACTYEIECPMHEGRFDLRTGAATREPCTVPVHRFDVRVINGIVQVRMP